MGTRRSVVGEPETVRCVVATDFSGHLIDEQAWDEAVAQMQGPVYMTWRWLRTWWKFYGTKRALRLIVCYCDDRIVGLIPTYIDVLGPRPFGLRVARLVGAHVPPKVFDPPLDPECAEDCIAATLQQLLEFDKCDVVSIGPVSGSSAPWSRFPEVVRAGNGRWRCADDTSDVHTIFHLPASQEVYLQSLSKNEQKHRRKYELRALAKNHTVEVVVSTGPEGLDDAFTEFADLHARQWAKEGKSGHFGAWPHGLEYNRALVEALGPCNRVRFVRIVANGETVASQFIFTFADRWYWELPARAPESTWDRFSLGPSAIVTMIREAIDANIHWIQGGLAHYDYKLRLGATEYPVVTYRASRSSFGSSVRVRLWSTLRSAIRVAYHRVIYRRLMPKLPARYRRAQWGFWLRLDY